MSNEADFASMLDERLSEEWTQSAIEDAERTWPASIWAAAERDGFTSIGLAEDNGGSGGDVGDACAVLRAVGHNAASGPWAESGLLAGYLTADLPGTVPPGVTTVAPGIVHGTVTPSDGIEIHADIRHVPWARAADHVLVVVRDDNDRSGLVVLPSSSLDISLGDNAAGEARDTVRLINPVVGDVLPLDSSRAEGLAAMGALSRAALISGAVERVADMTVTYTHQRHQFGRPISDFQLVQRLVVGIAEQSALVTGAVDGAARAAVDGGGIAEAVAAKIIANTAASEAARSAHQAHGAIGVTREYRLHQFTRRLWSWRAEYGSSNALAAWIGKRVVSVGPDALFPAITDLSLLTR